jgi:hypothetical protein
MKDNQIQFRREKYAHLEKGKPRPVAIVGPATIEQVSCRFHAVEADHVLTKHVCINDIGVFGVVFWSE